MILCQVSPLQPVMGAVIGALTGSDDPNEVAVMAKQASEVEISDLSSPSSSTTTPTIHIHTQPNHPHPYPWPKPHPDEILTLSWSDEYFRWSTWWSPWWRPSPPLWARGHSQTMHTTQKNRRCKNSRISKPTYSSRIVPSVIQGTADADGANSPHHIRVSSYPEFLNKFKLVSF